MIVFSDEDVRRRTTETDVHEQRVLVNLTGRRSENG